MSDVGAGTPDVADRSSGSPPAARRSTAGLPAARPPAVSACARKRPRSSVTQTPPGQSPNPGAAHQPGMPCATRTYASRTARQPCAGPRPSFCARLITCPGRTIRARLNDGRPAKGSLTASASAWAEAGQQRVIQPTEASRPLQVVAPLDEAATLAAVERTSRRILAPPASGPASRLRHRPGPCQHRRRRRHQLTVGHTRPG